MLLRKLILSLLVLFSVGFTSAFAGSGVDQDGNVTDAQGKKQGKWIYRGKDRPEAGYPAEGKIEEGTFVDDRKEGIWIKYYNDGVTPKLKGEFHNHRPDGVYIKYDASGQIIEKGTFEKSNYKDSLKRFIDGVCIYEAKFDDTGKESGKVTYRYPNGKPEFIYTAKEGKATGAATRYWPNGDVKEKITYDSNGNVVNTVQLDMVNPPVEIKSNEPKVIAPKIKEMETLGIPFQANGYNKVYNKNKEIWQDGQFKNGSLWDGKVYEYDSDGILLKVKVFKNGAYHSDGQL